MHKYIIMLKLLIANLITSEVQSSAKKTQQLLVHSWKQFCIQLYHLVSQLQLHCTLGSYVLSNFTQNGITPQEFSSCAWNPQQSMTSLNMWFTILHTVAEIVTIPYQQLGCSQTATPWGLGLRGCKNRPTLFPGWMSYKMTKLSSIALSILSLSLEHVYCAVN